MDGALALAAGYLAALAAQKLSRSGSLAPRARTAAPPWLGVPTPVAISPGSGGSGPRRAIGPGLCTVDAVKPGWLSQLGGRVCEYAVYGGLAVGASAGRASAWPLAITVLSLAAVREVMDACGGLTPDAPAGDSAFSRGVRWFLRMPMSGRLLLVALVVPAWGGRTALLAVLDWSIMAIGCAIVQRLAAAGRRAPEAARPRPPEPIGLNVLVLLSEPDEAAAPDQPPESSAAWLEGGEPGGVPLLPESSAIRFEPVEPASPQPLPEALPARLEPAAASAGPAAATAQPRRALSPVGAPPGRSAAVVLRCRDDGTIARVLGGLVRGQLVPLPPALLGLAATAALAVLGLRDLPSVVALTPAIVMLLAAAGASHPHSGRLDWLVPAALQGAQYIYVAGLGFATGVPPLLTLLLCAAIALHYADLAYGPGPALAPTGFRWWRAGTGRQPRAKQRDPGGWLGWEGRMLFAGLCAAAGIATFGYVILAGYLYGLLCWKVLRTMTGSLALQEGDSG